MEDQWAQLAAAAGDLAAAPDDEILAETLAVQAELLQQVCMQHVEEHAAGLGACKHLRLHLSQEDRLLCDHRLPNFVRGRQAGVSSSRLV